MELGGFSFGGTTFTFPPPTPPDYGSLPASVFQGSPYCNRWLRPYPGSRIRVYFSERPHCGPVLHALSRALRWNLHRRQ